MSSRGRDHRFLIEHGNFGQLGAFLKKHGVFGSVNGVLLDLGVSSAQLEDPNRGFSFQLDGLLDMRMDPTDAESAADWLNKATEKEIADVLFRFGEENAARRIARAICEYRAEQPIESTVELGGIIEKNRAAQTRQKTSGYAELSGYTHSR